MRVLDFVTSLNISLEESIGGDVLILDMSVCVCVSGRVVCGGVFACSRVSVSVRVGGCVYFCESLFVSVQACWGHRYRYGRVYLAD